MVFIKAPVFDRDGGVLHDFWDFVDGHEGAFFIAVDFEEKMGAGAVVNFGGLGDLAAAEGVGIGKVTANPGGEDGQTQNTGRAEA